MSIFDVVVNTDDLVVLGPPTNIDLAVDLGATGQRGSTFFVGSGDPNTVGVIPSGSEVIEGDIFINASTGSEYAWIYVANPGGASWEQVLKLQPSIYTRTQEATFNSSGIATVSIPLTSIISDITISDPDQYVVQLTPINTDPTVLTINSKSIASSNLEVTIEAIKYSSSTWSALVGTYDFCMTIAVV